MTTAADRLSLYARSPVGEWVTLVWLGPDAPIEDLATQVAAQLDAVGFSTCLRWDDGDRPSIGAGRPWPVGNPLVVLVEPGGDVIMVGTAASTDAAPKAVRLHPGPAAGRAVVGHLGWHEFVIVHRPLEPGRVLTYSGRLDHELERWAIMYTSAADTPRIPFPPVEVVEVGRWIGVRWRVEPLGLARRPDPLVIWTDARGTGIDRARNAITALGLTGAVGEPYPGDAVGTYAAILNPGEAITVYPILPH